jgi:Protein of unknown function (DUF4240)
MTETQFWSILDRMDWSRQGNDDEVIEPAVAALAQLPEDEIASFDDIMSEKLHALDGERYAQHIGQGSYGQSGEYFSADDFLYARASALTEGKTYYENIRSHPEEMPKDVEFEALLDIPRLAYERRTGREYRHVPRFNYETFSNREGWKSG